MWVRLQEEYLSLQDEIKVTIEESKVVQEKYRSMYEACRRELGEKQAQLEEIRAKVKVHCRHEEEDNKARVPDQNGVSQA